MSSLKGVIMEEGVVHRVFLSTPFGEIVTMEFDEHQWSMLHDIAILAGISLEQAISEVASEKYLS
jgi:GAF domain-containing protein